MAAYGAAVLLGLAVAASIFPLAALDGTLSLTHPVGGDAAQHIVGQRYFLADRWRWPPFTTQLIDAPRGVNVALTDSIPLVGLLAKPWARLLPYGAHFIYLWVAVCFVLQPAAGVFALRSAGERRVIPGLAAALFAVSMPAFIYRFGHAALCGHFLLLLAIGVYFKVTAQPGGRWWLGFPVLLILGLLAHPYLMAMVAGLLLAAPITLLARRQRQAAVRVAVRLAGSYALVGACMAAGGYLGAEPASGFGYYSLNLLAPFTPAGSAILGDYPIMDATGGQNEGYSYLGLGLAGLIVVALAQLRRPAARAWVVSQAGLLVVAAGALVFAVSNKVYLGHHLIAHLPAVPAILRQFRATGRFVWIDLYVVMVGAALLVCRSLRPRWAVGAMGVLALLQFADAGLLRSEVSDQVTTVAPWPIDPVAMRPVLARHRLMTLWPTAACRPEQVNNPLFMTLLLLASEQALPVNSIPVARVTGTDDCGTEAVRRRSLEPGELRLLLPGTAANLVEVLPDWRRQCHHFLAGLIACSDDGALAAGPPVEVAAFPLGRALSLGQPDGAQLAGQGWTVASPEGAWTIGTDASLLGTVPAAGGPMRLSMTAHGLAKGGRAQGVQVRANGALVATWQVAQDPEAVYQAILPAGIASGGTVVIDLAISEPVRPQDVMANGDPRLLGFFLTSFRLDQE